MTSDTVDRGGKSGRRQAWALALSGVLIAVVAGALLVTQVGGGQALPDYTWQLSAVDGSLDPASVALGDVVTAVATPTTEVDAVLSTRAYWVQQGVATPLKAQERVAPTGVVTASVTLEGAGLTAGSGELRLVVGPRFDLERVGAGLGDVPKTVHIKRYAIALVPKASD